MEFKNEKELVEHIYSMHLQNTSGRETEDEMFMLGIQAAIAELTELKLLNLHDVSNNEVAVCEIEGCNREILSDSTMCPHHYAVSLDSQTDC